MEENKKTELNEKETRKSGKNSIPGIFLRLILTTVTGIIIGFIIYFTAAGWIPYLEQRVFQPIDKNHADLEAFQATQQSLEDQIHLLQDSNRPNQATLEYLEMEIEQLKEDGLSILSTVEMSAQYILQYTQSIATLEANLDSTDRNLSALATAQMRNSDLQQRLSLLKILDLLTLSNQYLLHANYGQAENQLNHVKTELEDLFIQAPAYQQTFIHDLLNLVDQTIEDLPENYSLAEDKVQLAIQMVLQGYPELDPSASLTATPFISPTLTPTP